MTRFLVVTFLDVALLWVLATTKGHWLPRALAIVVILPANLLLLAPPDVSGYATTAAPPARAVVVGCHVDEPDSVYLWLLNPDPRGYKQPYTRSLHELCVASRKAAAEGEPFAVERVPNTAAGVPGQPIPKWAYRRYVLPPQIPHGKET